MPYRWLADVAVAAHFAFIVFVALGGLAAIRWPRLVWLHVPAALWGAAIELVGGICPLTPLENRWRRLAGEAGYEGGFIDHYLVPVIYPEGLTRPIQIALGLAVLAVNAAAYLVVWRRHRREPRT